MKLFAEQHTVTLGLGRATGTKQMKNKEAPEYGIWGGHNRGSPNLCLTPTVQSTLCLTQEALVKLRVRC